MQLLLSIPLCSQVLIFQERFKDNSTEMLPDVLLSSFIHVVPVDRIAELYNNLGRNDLRNVFFEDGL